MNENIKTLSYVGLAVAAIIVAVASSPRPAEVQIDSQVDKPLFADFADPNSAASLEVVELDEELAQLSRFSVAKKPGTNVWTIPSHNDYPADAEQRLRDAATMFVDLKVVGVASELPEEHAELGVMDPTKSDRVEQKGAGKLVRIQDRNGDVLAELVIGKADTTGLRFVRRPTQDAVYVVEIDPEKLTTSFDEWINRDILDINAFDVAEIGIRDYWIERDQQQARLLRRFDLNCVFDSTSNEWKVDSYHTYANNRPVEATLADDEVLNQQLLNDLKNALRDVEIVDVQRKPEGFGKDLRSSSEISDNQETRLSLLERGFYPQRIDANTVELFAANGELTITTKDGVRYLLRFGEIAGHEKEAQDKLTRYMFVTASVDESMFPMPEPPPGLDLSQPQPPPTTPPVEGAATDGDQSTPSPPADQDVPNEGDCGQEPLPQDPPADAPPPQDPPADAPPPQDPPADATDQQPVTDDIAAEAQRERLRTEFQRKLDDREEKLKNARIKVAQLNARFADWYYVISEDVYKKLHLTRTQLFTDKAPSDDDQRTDLPSFRDLQEGGLKP